MIPFHPFYNSSSYRRYYYPYRPNQVHNVNYYPNMNKSNFNNNSNDDYNKNYNINNNSSYINKNKYNYQKYDKTKNNHDKYNQNNNNNNNYNNSNNNSNNDNNKNNLYFINTDTSANTDEEKFFDFFGIKLAFDDLLILALLFFLYKEDTKDPYLYISLILLLLS